MGRLKVLFAAGWYPTCELPLVASFVRDQAKAVALFDDVVVLHYAGPKPHLRSLWQIEPEHDKSVSEGIPTYRVSYREFSGFSVPSLLSYWAFIRACRRITAGGFEPDIIHAQIYFAAVPAAMVALASKTPLVVSEHSSAFARNIVGKLGRWKARIAFSQARRVVVVSRALQKSIEEYGIKAQFQVVPNVVDTSLFLPSSHEHSGHAKRILLVCHLDVSDKKGIRLLFRALASLSRIRGDWCVDIVGDGAGRAEYESLARALGLASSITFHGGKLKHQVASFMRQADFLVVPSLYETFSVVAAEALASGIPVLATCCGGPGDFITEEVGILVPPGDEEALCAGLDDMLDRCHRFPSMRLSEYARERFAPIRIGAQLHQIYEECIRETG